MARETRKKISYELPLANSPGGHRLGVNGLAIDVNQSILYSGGRDGSVIAWDLNLDLSKADTNGIDSASSPSLTSPSSQKKSRTSFRSQAQAHTHWVNDIVLTHSALISASSDLTVKAWRPHSEEGNLLTPTIGSHGDYVKCLATPGDHVDWVASGGLDHRICLWDLNGAGEKLQINVGEGQDEQNMAKGSVYALAAKASIIASGGPESVVRIWDPKSGKSITKFAGHTDNIRDILINQDGDTVMTASSDQTVKIWSMTAGRCLHTFTMHNDSVWSLHSDHPQLSIFYSSDRSGLVAKTDTRNVEDMDEGICVALCQEHDGVARTVCAGDYIWTATASSSINRWNDVDTTLEIQLPDSPILQSVTGNSASQTPSPSSENPPTTNGVMNKIPFSSLLRLTNTAVLPGRQAKDADVSTLYSTTSMRNPSEAIDGSLIVLPIRDLPEETIEGQHGLIKHYMMNDKKRVLTLDTAGEVVLWDILKCLPIQSFGKRHLEDVAPEVNTTESIANWCTVDTRTGKLSVMLESNYCFDAELYADEIFFNENLEFREDQRINLGKWVLRYLFTHLVDEEIRRDGSFRKQLLVNEQKSAFLQRGNAPTSIDLPAASFSQDAEATPRPNHGLHGGPLTPGLTIGLATPAIPPTGMQVANHLTPTAEEDTKLEKRSSRQSQARSSTEKQQDYFSNPPILRSETSSDSKAPATPGEGATAVPTSPTTEPEKEEKKRKGSLFGKKIQMNFPKKLGRNSTEVKPPAAEEKVEEASEKSSEKEEKVFDDNLYGVIQRIRSEYVEHLLAHPGQLGVGIAPSQPSETPILNLPPDTAVIIQEDRPDAGGVADLYRGSVGTLGKDVDIIEQVAPVWLGELLLRNQVPLKNITSSLNDPSKISFFLNPHQNSLPSIANSDGNNRLNANRMLRAKKILSYVAERLEPMPEDPDPTALKPEEYLELYCQGQLVGPNVTLATLRTYYWKSAGDPTLYYKSNGRKEIAHTRNSFLSSVATENNGNGNTNANPVPPLTPGPATTTATASSM